MEIQIERQATQEKTEKRRRRGQQKNKTSDKPKRYLAANKVGEDDAKEAISSRSQKPAKQVLKKPPLPGVKNPINRRHSRKKKPANS